MKLNDRTRRIIDRVFINMPIRLINDKYLRLIEKHRINLEIGLDYYSLDNYSYSYIRTLAEQLKKFGTIMTVHAPFNEIFLGAPDRLIREASLSRMDEAFELAQYFSPQSIVMHLNFEMRRFGFIYDEWFANIIPNLKVYAERCREIGAILAIENVYEETPDAMISIMNNLEEYPVCHCMDVGHVNAFSSVGIPDWIEKTESFICQFHLHDNNGYEDTHAPIGHGNIDYSVIVEVVSKMKRPSIITLEPHSQEDLWRTLKGFEQIGLDQLLNPLKQIFK
ncbi:MAG: TIM barrel protein [Spirochaetota bacterium]|nr:TIM barrel protein [Spirochaetota bacterium]